MIIIKSTHYAFSSIILRTFCLLMNKFYVNLNFFAVEASAVHQRLQMQAANSRNRPRNSRNSSPQKTVGTCQRSKMSSWPDPRRSDVLKQNTWRSWRITTIVSVIAEKCAKCCRKLRPNLWRPTPWQRGDLNTHQKWNLQIMKTISSIILLRTHLQSLR